MFKKAILILLLIFSVSLNPAHAFNTVPNFKVLIDKASKITALPKKLNPPLLQVPKSRKAWFNPDCTTDFPSTELFLCYGGDLNSKKLIILYGDSHASMWMTAVDTIGKSKGYKTLLLAKLACPILQKAIWSYQLNKPFNECDEWNQKALAKIMELKPDYLIITNQWKPAVENGAKNDFGTNSLWEEEFPKALAALKPLAKNTILIGNNPSMTEDPLRCASKPRQNLLLCASFTPNADNHIINKIESDSAKALKIPYIDTVGIACSKNLCPVVINGYFVYFDQWHFTDQYVQFVTPWLAKQLALV
ncbi:MAG: SGNH hydrolase domain-containing protein [Candidatus Nanopelagicaceae bacterium]